MKHSLSFVAGCRLATNICGIVTAFISFRLYNLYLTKDLFGIVLVGMQFLTYLPLLGGGFSMVLGQQMLAEPNPDHVVATSRFNQVLQNHLLVLALAAGLALMIFYSQMPTSRSMGLPLPLFLAIGLAGVGTFYAGGQMGLLIIYGGRQIYGVVLQGGWSILSLLLLWGGFSLGWGVWSMPLSTIGSTALIVLITWVLLQRRLRGIPILAWRRAPDFWPRLRGIWSSSFAWLRTQVFILLLFTLDIILVGLLFGPGPAAVYGIISRVCGMSRQVIQSLCDAAWPRMAEEPDPERKADLMRKLDRLNAWITGAWYGAMAATLHPFLGWLMKADWVAGPWLLGLMLARSMISSLTAPHSYGLISAGRFREIARAVLREVIFGIIAMIIFSHFFGVTGLAFATVAATCGCSLWILTRLYFSLWPRQHWFREWCAVYARGLVSAGIGFVFAGASWWGESFLHAPGWAAVFAGGIGLGAGLAAGVAFGTSQSQGQTRAYGRLLKLPTRW